MGVRATGLQSFKHVILFFFGMAQWWIFFGLAAQTKGSDAVSVNKAPAFKNSKSGLRYATEEPIFKSVCLS